MKRVDVWMESYGWVFGRRTKNSGTVQKTGEVLPVKNIIVMGIMHFSFGELLFGPMSVLDDLLVCAYLRKVRLGIKYDLERILELFPALRNKLRRATGSFGGVNSKW